MDENLAFDAVKSAYEDGFVEFNGRQYDFLKMQHLRRRTVFSFFSTIMQQVQQGNFAFLSSKAYEPIEKILFDHIQYDGSLLSKLPNHWEEYPEDYLEVVSTAMGVMSYPFMKGSRTD